MPVIVVPLERTDKRTMIPHDDSRVEAMYATVIVVVSSGHKPLFRSAIGDNIDRSRIGTHGISIGMQDRSAHLAVPRLLALPVVRCSEIGRIDVPTIDGIATVVSIRVSAGKDNRYASSTRVRAVMVGIFPKSSLARGVAVRVDIFTMCLGKGIEPPYVARVPSEGVDVCRGVSA